MTGTVTTRWLLACCLVPAVVIAACQKRGSEDRGPHAERGIDLAERGKTVSLPLASLGPGVVKIFDPSQPGSENMPCALLDKRFPSAAKLIEHLGTLDDAFFEQGLLLVRENKMRAPWDGPVFPHLRTFAIDRNVDLFVLMPPEADAGSAEHVQWFVRSTRTPYRD